MSNEDKKQSLLMKWVTMPFSPLINEIKSIGTTVSSIKDSSVENNSKGNRTVNYDEISKNISEKKQKERANFFYRKGLVFLFLTSVSFGIGIYTLTSMKLTISILILCSVFIFYTQAKIDLYKSWQIRHRKIVDIKSVNIDELFE